MHLGSEVSERDDESRKEEVELQKRLEGALAADLDHLRPPAHDRSVLRLDPRFHSLLTVAGQVACLAEELLPVHLERPEDDVVD